MTTEELERSIQEIWYLFKETDNKFKETDNKFKETDKKFQETDKKFQETDIELKETIKKTSKVVERVSNAVDKLTGKWGRFVEGMVVPAVKVMFKARNIGVEKIFQRVEVHKNGKNMEIDIMAVNHEHVLLIEAKSTLAVDDVKDHLERLKEFKEFFPEYTEKKVLGGVAGIVIEEGVDRYAYQQGLFVIGQSGETVKILNDEKFRPKIW